MSTVDFHAFSNVIAGALRSSAHLGHGINPSTREPLWNVPIATAQDLEDAVSAAQEASTKWSSTPWEKRQDCLGRAKVLLEQHRASIAQLLSLEGGKPPQFGDLEVQHALDFFNFYSTLPQPQPEIIQDDADLRLTLTYGPIGVVGAICPWNYPLVLAVGKIVPALLAGNCVITKPSPYTPYSIIKFTEIIRHIFPAGVIQAMHGGDDLGPRMCNHPAIQKISFTGSTATGKKIMASASSGLKNITLELGGNSASIIFPDVDIDIVAPQVALGSFFNSGQLCVASKRVYVHKDIYDAFLRKMVEVVKSWKVGSPSTPGGVMLGPVQNEMQYNVVRSILRDSIDKGYRFALGGQLPADASSFIISPSIVDNPPDDSLVVKAEAFGPIVPVLSWSDEDELLSRVNDTTTGLGGAVWSSDIDRARRIASRIHAGTVWINSFEKPLPQAYLAGHKESGVGGEWGRHGLLSFCNPQIFHYYKSPVASKL
ncbi:Aldedh domain-containing protein [Fusarium keratoplasticum]|uniref:Aldedh domain-containing protein n=1 Tax=Fusarium keratoplasticum TaxID=1328300 RepID=A0ACC0QUN4_9HYPO|nr:Aldedh domain-containing protein [Fusarium keratoplasticum]KAI8666854.1 Aldedh domain-containing protein [Fusarium keratoplasticum]KAI8668554.1 Aldedh domain-containing protein [Fusarium keratoplasticum]